jgi:hypothetical protein
MKPLLVRVDDHMTRVVGAARYERLRDRKGRGTVREADLDNDAGIFGDEDIAECVAITIRNGDTIKVVTRTPDCRT